MKKQYIPLAVTLMASSAGFAQNGDAQPMKQMQMQDQQSSDCCRVCCVPKPRDPICCECYVPSWNDMQCDWGLFLTVDFLYWYARECGLNYATKMVNQGQFATGPAYTGDTANRLVPTDAINMDTKWAPGVRAGLGWNTDCDGWDLYFQWTGYWNNNRDSASVADFDGVPAVGGYALFPSYLNTYYGTVPFSDGTTGTIEFPASQVKARWNLKYNRFDLQMGKRYWLSRCFTMRPYAGLGGIWTETTFSGSIPTSQVTFGTAGSITLQGKFKDQNNNWGVGFVGGFQPTWQFSDCFALFGDAGMALLWGRLQEKHTQVTSGVFSAVVPNAPGDEAVVATQEILPINYQNTYYCMTPILDLALGLRWETYWCDQQYHFALDLGWEHHVLLHHTHRTNFAGTTLRVVGGAGVDSSLAVPAGPTSEYNIALGGFILRARFDF